MSKNNKYLSARHLLLTILMAVGVYSFAQAQQIAVTPAQTALALSQKLVGKGVTIKNATLTCPSVANGLFTATTGILGIDSGIVLTTGLAATQISAFGVDGPSSFLASTNNHAPGDIVLNGLAGQNTYDACALEFDVIPQGDTLKFDYVFSSEEYINAVCGPYNDAFAFFISGPGISGQQNMALVPGTNIPVTINSVNNGTPGRGHNIADCNAMGPGSPFTSYYIDNSHGLYLTHNGRTTVLQAIHNVMPCGMYHLKMVIADAGNATYDSGVFLKAGSLQTSSYAVTSVPPAAPAPVKDTLPFAVKGCLPGHFRVSRSVASGLPLTLHYTFGGTAVKGIDYTVAADSITIPANDTAADVVINGIVTAAGGAKRVNIYIALPANCSIGGTAIADSASLILYDSLNIKILTPDTALCTGVYFPLLVSGADYLNYSWTSSDNKFGSTQKDPAILVQAAMVLTVSASLPGTTCISNAPLVKISIHKSPAVVATAPAKVCVHGPVQLSAQVTPPGNEYTYQWDGPAGFASSLPEPYLLAATANASGIYVVHATNDSNLCVGADSVKILVVVPDTPSVVTPQIVCQNKENVQLYAKGKGISFTWYTSLQDTIGSSDAPVVPTGAIAVYDYYVSQVIAGCESDKSGINVSVEKCCDGNVFVPDAFTPNNDGKNDKFEISKNYGYYIEKLQVYNRWGQMMFDGHGDNGWDGRFGGASAEVGNYFYYLRMSCINGGIVERKGTVVLIK